MLVLVLRRLRWKCVNDVVMGGKSCSSVEVMATADNDSDDDSSLRFWGKIDLDGGGFASCRSSGDITSITTFDDDDGNGESINFAGAKRKGVRVIARGDGNLYKCLLRTSSCSYSYQADFQTRSDGQKTVHEIPFEAFRPKFRGRTVENAPPMAAAVASTADIASVGFMLSLKTTEGLPNHTIKNGPFELRVSSLALFL